MHPRNIVTFPGPVTSTNSLPLGGGSSSPTTNQAPLYRNRVDGQTRTIYVTSNVNIFEGDTHTMNALRALANGPEFENEQEDLTRQPIRRTHSSSDTRTFITESAVDRSEASRMDRSLRHSSPIVNLEIYQHGPQPHPATRQSIFFYNKNDPYYGFTNFSPDPVTYKGKQYPTSEHLFQSFKVLAFFMYLHM